MNNYKLILMDVDGTITDRDSTEIYPKMWSFIEALDQDCQVALVTNQGGPACHDAGWPWSETYPSLQKTEERLGQILLTLEKRDHIYGMFVCYAYKQKNGVIILPKGKIKSDRCHSYFAFSELAFRKPEPGMILAAMKEYRVVASETLMIGDRPEDRAAAEAAGVAFRHADDI